jgi:spore germination protein KA
MENMKVGALSKTDIVITYLDGIVKDSLVEEVRQRIARIDIDAILESGYIEELIQDNSFTVFPQLGVTERPDRLAAALLEGHVGILVDNTPMVLITPEIFVDMIDATEDYYGNYILASSIRLLRYLFLGISIFLPSFYIALLTFHHGMVPRTLLLSIVSSREGVPFPLFIESLMMQIFFEGLQEASTRLPRVVGQTVSIVGGLVLGQAAVQAGIVSAATVIIVSITGIATFIIPRFNLVPTIRIIRFFMMILSGLLGLYGIFIGTLITLIHMVKLRSFGASYLSPLAPLNLIDLKDTFVRAPLWAMIFRPEYTEPKDQKRMKKNMRPRKPKQNK